MLLLLSLGFAEHLPALGTSLDGAKASKCFSIPVPQKGRFLCRQMQRTPKKHNKSCPFQALCVTHCREMSTEPSLQSMS